MAPWRDMTKSSQYGDIKSCFRDPKDPVYVVKRSSQKEEHDPAIEQKKLTCSENYHVRISSSDRLRYCHARIEPFSFH